MVRKSGAEGDRGLEEALVDLVRVGASGDQAGVRQLARRLLKAPPTGVHDAAVFKSSVASALANGVSAAPTTSGLRAVKPDEIPVDRESGFALALVDAETAEEPILAPHAQQQIQDFVRERRRAGELMSRGLFPSRSLLIIGPPGTGKTMAARFIASELGLPLLIIDLASVMSSYLGKTGQNLREGLLYGKAHQCALLLDEFDALAKRRDDDSDIGELKRLVNVLLLELERWPPDGLLIAASNHPELLDRAVSRRFDQISELELPQETERRRLFARHVHIDTEFGEEWLTVAVWATEGWSGSDIVRLIQDSARRGVLDGTTTEHELIASLRERLALAAGEAPDRRAAIARLARDTWTMSNREIARLLGTTHPTVGRLLARQDAD